jgi:hypothetical protein
VSLVAPTLQLLFTQRLAKQRQASPATVRAYRNAIVLLLRFTQDRTGKPPSTLDWDDLGIETISAFPGPPRGRPPQQRPKPQRPSRRRAVALPLRGPATSRARAAHRPGPGHPPEALRQGAGVVPRTCGGRRPARRPGPQPVGGKAGPCAHRAGAADRASALGADRDPQRRHRVGQRRPRPLHRQGPQAALYSADHGQRRHPAGLVPRARRAVGGPAVPHTQRAPAQRRRRRSTRLPLQRHRRPAVPVARAEALDAPRPAPHLRHEPIARGCRRRRDRSVARPR